MDVEWAAPSMDGDVAVAVLRRVALCHAIYRFTNPVGHLFYYSSSVNYDTQCMYRYTRE